MQRHAAESKGSVVVTGASTGIGWGTVKVLAGAGFHVFGTVRKETDAERLRQEFGEAVTPLRMDVTDADSVKAAAAQVLATLGTGRLAGLVNNAGVAVPGPLLYLTAAEFRRQLEVNLVGVLVVTQAFTPLLGSDRSRTGRPGRIVNISSVGGKFGAPFLGAYVASKHGLEGFSESLRRELLLYGIDVIIVGPGSVVTPIWDKAEREDFGVAGSTEYGPILERFQNYMIAEGRKGLPPEEIGRTVLTALTASAPKVRYAVVPRKLTNWTIPRLLPRRLLDRLIARSAGLVNDSGAA